MRKSSNRLKPAKCTCWIPTKSLLPKPPSSARQHWPKNMDYAEFDALTRGWRSLRQNNNPGPRIRAGTDASAIHRRLGAQVALLQSPILPAAYLPCIERRRTFRGLPVDKPHTRNSRTRFFAFSKPRRIQGISTTDYTDFTDIFAGFFLIRAIRAIRVIRVIRG